MLGKELSPAEAHSFYAAFWVELLHYFRSIIKGQVSALRLWDQGSRTGSMARHCDEVEGSIFGVSFIHTLCLSSPDKTPSLCAASNKT